MEQVETALSCRRRRRNFESQQKSHPSLGHGVKVRTGASVAPRGVRGNARGPGIAPHKWHVGILLSGVGVAVLDTVGAYTVRREASAPDKTPSNGPGTNASSQGDQNHSVLQSPAAEAIRRDSATVAPATQKSATLKIEVTNQFTVPSLSVWVDDGLAYTHDLREKASKRLLVFRRIHRAESGAVQVRTGRHSIRIRVRTSLGDYEQSTTIAQTFVSGGRKALRVSFGKHQEMHVDVQ